jgi:hypothetical protein
VVERNEPASSTVMIAVPDDLEKGVPLTGKAVGRVASPSPGC